MSPSDDLPSPQLSQPFGRQAERFAVDLLIVLAEPGRKAQRRRLADRWGRQRDAEAGSWVRDLHEPLGDERIGHDVGERADAGHRDAGTAERFERLAGAEIREAVGQRAIQPVDIGDAAGVGRVLGPTQPGEAREGPSTRPTPAASPMSTGWIARWPTASR